MLTVRHLGISQSERIVWLCEELGLDYELKRYGRRADNRLAPDDYKALHPMGIAPVITDGDLVLGESGAICDYLCARYDGGKLTPGRGDPDFADKLVAATFGNLAMDAVLSGRSGLMASLVEGRYTMSPIPDPALGPRKVDIATMYNTDRYRPNYGSKMGLPIFLTRG